MNMLCSALTITIYNKIITQQFQYDEIKTIGFQRKKKKKKIFANEKTEWCANNLEVIRRLMADQTANNFNA